MKTAYLIHGTSTRDDDWFPWLEEAASPEWKVERLSLPHPFSPDHNEWQAAIDRQIGNPESVTLITHSLGGIATLRYLQHSTIKHANLILVGVFDQPLPNYPQLNSFLTPSLDYQRLRAKIKHATVITAKDDPIAPYTDAIKVAKKLSARLIVQEHGGHFLTSDGYQKFPLVLEELQKIG